MGTGQGYKGIGYRAMREEGGGVRALIPISDPHK